MTTKTAKAILSKALDSVRQARKGEPTDQIFTIRLPTEDGWEYLAYDEGNKRRIAGQVSIQRAPDGDNGTSIVKSFKTTDEYRDMGVGRALLENVVNNYEDEPLILPRGLIDHLTNNGLERKGKNGGRRKPAGFVNIQHISDLDPDAPEELQGSFIKIPTRFQQT